VSKSPSSFSSFVAVRTACWRVFKYALARLPAGLVCVSFNKNLETDRLGENETIFHQAEEGQR